MTGLIWLQAAPCRSEMPSCRHGIVTFSVMIHRAVCVRGGRGSFCKHVQLFKLQASDQRFLVETLRKDAFPQTLKKRADGENTQTCPQPCRRPPDTRKWGPERALCTRSKVWKGTTTSELWFSSFDWSRLGAAWERSWGAPQTQGCTPAAFRDQPDLPVNVFRQPGRAVWRWPHGLSQGSRLPRRKAEAEGCVRT